MISIFMSVLSSEASDLLSEEGSVDDNNHALGFANLFLQSLHVHGFQSLQMLSHLGGSLLPDLSFKRSICHLRFSELHMPND